MKRTRDTVCSIAILRCTPIKLKNPIALRIIPNIKKKPYTAFSAAKFLDLNLQGDGNGTDFPTVYVEYPHKPSEPIC